MSLLCTCSDHSQLLNAFLAASSCFAHPGTLSKHQYIYHDHFKTESRAVPNHLCNSLPWCHWQTLRPNYTASMMQRPLPTVDITRSFQAFKDVALLHMQRPLANVDKVRSFQAFKDVAVLHMQRPLANVDKARSFQAFKDVAALHMQRPRANVDIMCSFQALNYWCRCSAHAVTMWVHCSIFTIMPWK